MANTIVPWISAYLIGIGEEHGASLSKVPIFEKKKKVQLVDFLTYGSDNDDCIWAKVSDKHHRIPIRFNKVALAEYSRDNSKRLTEHKTVVISIKNFKPFFSRIPLGNGKKEMSRDGYLVLECAQFSLIGSIGEAEWGSPVEIEQDQSLLNWTRGLRRDGGDGNILKVTKNAFNQISTLYPKTSRPLRATVKPSPVKKRIPSTDSPALKSLADAVTTTLEPSLLREYQRSWRLIQEGSLQYSRSSDIVKDLLRNMSVVGDSIHSGPLGAKPATPSAKRRRIGPIQHALELSIPQRRQSPERHHSEQCTIDAQTTPPLTDWSMSPSVRGSPPCQGYIPPAPYADPALPSILETDYEPSTKPIPNADTTNFLDIAAPTPPGQQPRHLPLLTSSPMPPSSALLSLTTHASSSVLTTLGHERRPVTRKVPRPQQPLSPNSPATGSGQILVPNSDTSGTASQPHSQSQQASQPAFLSQLLSFPHWEEHDQKTQEKSPASHSSLFSFHEVSQPGGCDSDTSSPGQRVMVNARLNLRHRLPTLGEHSGGDLISAPTPGLSGTLLDTADGKTEKECACMTNAQKNQREVAEIGPTSCIKQAQRPQFDTQYLDHHVADEDDTQIDEQLFGSPSLPGSHVNSLFTITKDNNPISGKPTPSIQTTKHLPSPSSPATHKPSSAFRHTRLRRTSPISSIPDLPSPRTATLRPQTKTDSPLSPFIEPQVRAVEHDAEAWRAPAFQQNPNKGRRDVMAVRTKDGCSPGKMIITSSSGYTSQMRSCSPSCGRQVFPLMDRSSRSMKRARDTSHDSFDAKGEATKQRKVTDSDLPNSRRSSTTTEDRSNKQMQMGQKPRADIKLRSTNSAFNPPSKGKLAGFTLNLDSIPLDNSEPAWLSWEGLKDVLLRTGRKRAK